ncbi:MAG TPA: TlpA disulfide reductase family protein [Thermoanaerobaculia bacterium]|nr:TlpA disulfide reductase family protein [Thermoanaerobaculia bacterium]
MQQQAFSFVSDHYLAIFVVAIVAGVAILATIARPRRWFHWAVDAIVILVIAAASLSFWFFTTVTRILDHRTSTVAYAMLDAPDVHRVAGLRGNVVVLNYWATWCPPCRKEMPDLSRLADAYRNKGVVVLTISSEEPEILRKFLAKYPQSTMTARFSSDAPHTGIERMAYNGRPTTLVLDRDGRMRRMLIGGRTYEDFDAAVRAAM